MTTSSGTPEPAEARERIVQAAIEVIASQGFGGASARAVARAAGCNQALIYYYFDDMKALFLEALDETNRRRLGAYRARIDDIHTLDDLARVGESLWRDDQEQESSYMAVAAGMVAAALQHPDLGTEVVKRLQPWVDLAEESISRAIGGTFVAKLVSTRDLAQALVALFLGMELLYHLDHDPILAQRLFGTFTRVAKVASPLLSSPMLRAKG